MVAHIKLRQAQRKQTLHDSNPGLWSILKEIISWISTHFRDVPRANQAGGAVVENGLQKYFEVSRILSSVCVRDLSIRMLVTRIIEAK